MEEEIEELLKRKDDYDFAYGTQIYKPYTMSEKDWELIENLLTRYKQLEEENKKKDKRLNRQFKLLQKKDKEIEELKADNSHQWEERCRLTFELENSIPKSKVKEKIEEYKKVIEITEEKLKHEENVDVRRRHTTTIEQATAGILVLQELLES